ncbi:MAG: hypothetical protein U9M98_00620 [Patescibacteria group bacterium]|nr:hypothetical protein [Patescibacteria group bacterium]
MILKELNTLFTKVVYAQDISPLREEEVAPYTNLGQILSTAIQIALVGAGIVVLLMVIWGGIQYMTSGGDKEAAQTAQKRITAALVGLVIVVSAYAIAVIVEQVFGIQIVSGINLPTAEHQIGK